VWLSNSANNSYDTLLQGVVWHHNLAKLKKLLSIKKKKNNASDSVALGFIKALIDFLNVNIEIISRLNIAC
jgi:hypothetical protein